MRYILFNLTVLCAVGYLIFQNTPVVQDWKNTATDFISAKSPTNVKLQQLTTALLEKIENLEARQQELLAKLDQAPVQPPTAQPEQLVVEAPEQETAFMSRNDRRQELLKLSEKLVMKSIEE